jgi:hypothetical protein
MATSPPRAPQMARGRSATATEAAIKANAEEAASVRKQASKIKHELQQQRSSKYPRIVTMNSYCLNGFNLKLKAQEGTSIIGLAMRGFRRAFRYFLLSFFELILSDEIFEVRAFVIVFSRVLKE